MDNLHRSLLLHILNRLDDSADVARCRVASKAFNSLYPEVRSIKLRCSGEWYFGSTHDRRSKVIKSFKAVLLDHIAKQRIVESVCIKYEDINDSHGIDDFYFTQNLFTKEWLSRVSVSLKSLSIYGLPNYEQSHRYYSSNYVLDLISAHCNNLVNLKLKSLYLSEHNLSQMPMLTSLTLASTRLCDRQLSKLVEYLPNLQVLNLEGVIGVQELKIHHFNLKTCHLVVNTVVHNCQESITLVTPNLIALKVVSALKATLHVEAPMLSRFHLSIPALCNACEFHVKGFEYLKTLWLECNHIGSSLSRFPITRTLENLTLSSRNKPPRVDARGSQATIRKVFTIFPNVSSLCIKSNTWLELEACLDPQGWEILDGRKGLRTIRGYLMLVDLSLTFSCVARVVDQCVGLSEVSLLINRDVIYHRDDSGHVPKSFMSKCMARWPELKWRWGIWGEHGKDYWITDPITGQELIKCVRACNEVGR